MRRLPHLLSTILWIALHPTALAQDAPRASGYHGVWYANQPTGDEHRFKYSGGLGTYPQQHLPLAVYDAESHRTFFCYGGVSSAGQLQSMVSYFDHGSRTFPAPAILLEKHTGDAHDNPSLAMDARGHLWVFSNAHGRARESWVHRSVQPRSIDGFEEIYRGNFSYGQPWLTGPDEITLLHTLYDGGRFLYVNRLSSGTALGPPSLLARVEKGHYQISASGSGKLATLFNRHPQKAGLNGRTDLYYLESADGGRNWTDAAGTPLELPVQHSDHASRILDAQESGDLIYLKDLRVDTDSNPVALYLRSGGWRPGPESGPREWFTSRFDGERWVHRAAFFSDHNYDFGSLYLESNGSWRVIAPTDPGPQPHATGGEVVMWRSEDQGENWYRHRTLTSQSVYNHNYVRRPVHAHPDFYAFWADGHAWERSASHLYFTDREGSAVWRMPREVSGPQTAPERIESASLPLQPMHHRPAPNVVLIFADDLGTLDLQCYGSTDLHTPHLDALADRGVRFTQFYAAAPICSPSRAALLTGRYPQRAGVPGNVGEGRPGLPSDQHTLAELLKPASYSTALIGKWHLGTTPEQSPLTQGFDYFFGHLRGCIDNYSHFFHWAAPNIHDLWRNEEEIWAEPEHFGNLIVEEACEFLRRQGEEPFFLFLPFNTPHYPLQGLPHWRAYYEKLPSPRRQYAALVSTLDEHIGAILDELRRLQMEDNTLVVFLSDHGHSTEARTLYGGGNAGPYRGAKFSLLEGGIRVPAIFSFPGVLPRGETRDQFATALDVFPTVAELAGRAWDPTEVDGRSLLPLLLDGSQPSPHSTYHWMQGNQWAVRHGDWKLVVRGRDTNGSRLPDSHQTMLSDMSRHARERENLAERHPEIVEELRVLHRAWAESLKE